MDTEDKKELGKHRKAESQQRPSERKKKSTMSEMVKEVKTTKIDVKNRQTQGLAWDRFTDDQINIHSLFVSIGSEFMSKKSIESIFVLFSLFVYKLFLYLSSSIYKACVRSRAFAHHLC